MKLKHLLIGFGFLAVIVSCQKEISFEGESTTVKCVNCTYLPFCDSSVFVYVNTTASGTDTATSIPRILGDTIVNGQKFTKVSAVSFFDEGLLYNCANEDYKVVFPTETLGLDLDSVLSEILQQLPLPIPPGMIQVPSQFRTTVLKANAAVNQTWTDTLFNAGQPPLFSFFAGLKYTVKEKGVQRSVLQKNYPNVIHVQGEVILKSPLGSMPLGATIDYYFARGVGFIEIEVNDGTSIQLNSKLYSYKL